VSNLLAFPDKISTETLVHRTIAYANALIAVCETEGMKPAYLSERKELIRELIRLELLETKELMEAIKRKLEADL
jgi:hypothetical protein